MSIGVEFLNFAHSEVGNNEGAITGHCQTIWFIAAQTADKLLFAQSLQDTKVYNRRQDANIA